VRGLTHRVDYWLSGSGRSIISTSPQTTLGGPGRPPPLKFWPAPSHVSSNDAPPGTDCNGSHRITSPSKPGNPAHLKPSGHAGSGQDRVRGRAGRSSGRSWKRCPKMAVAAQQMIAHSKPSAHPTRKAFSCAPGDASASFFHRGGLLNTGTSNKPAGEKGVTMQRTRTPSRSWKKWSLTSKDIRRTASLGGRRQDGTNLATDISSGPDEIRPTSGLGMASVTNDARNPGVAGWSTTQA
jgi:hypothetical protein